MPTEFAPRRSWTWLLLLLPFLMLVPYVFSGKPYGYDESYHVAAARHFHQALVHPGQFLATLRDYDSPAGPVTFIIWALWGGLFGFGPTAMRLLMLAVSCLDVLLLYRIAREQRAAHPVCAAFLLMTSPYFFLTGFMAMTQNFAMVFALAGLLFFLRGGLSDPRKLAAAVLLATMAALCRQVWVFLPAAMGAAWLLARARTLHCSGRQATELRPGRVATDLSLLAIPALTVGALFVYWGGFTNRAWSTRYREIYDGLGLGARVDELHLQPVFVGLFLICAGAYFWSSLLTCSPRWKPAALCAAVAAPAFLLLAPRHGFGGGLILRTAQFLGQTLRPEAETAVLFALWLVGTLVLAGAWFRRPVVEEASIPAGGLAPGARGMLFLSLGFFVVVNAAGSRIWERYMIEAVPFLVLLCFDRIDRHRWLLYAWASAQSAVALGYACYKCLYQFDGKHFF